MRHLVSVVAAFAACVGASVLSSLSSAQTAPSGRATTAAPTNGVRRTDLGWQAFTNATLHVAPGKSVPNATLVVRDGKIAAILIGEGGKPAPTPIGPTVRDCTGLHIYPGFIDAFVEAATPLPDVTAPGAHWSSKVLPQRSVLDGNGLGERDADALRSQGFVAAALVPVNAEAGRSGAGDDEDVGPQPSRQGGVFRGRGAVVSLGRKPEGVGSERPPVYREEVFHALAFELSGGRRAAVDMSDPERWPSYPSSEMGAIAMIRQTLSDADWTGQTRKDGFDVPSSAIDVLISKDVPLYVATGDELEALRAAKIAKEFGRKLILKGSGMEFRRLDAIVEAAGTTTPVVVPLTFPRTPDVATFGAAEAAGLRELMTWEQAPSNLRRLKDRGVKVAITSADLRRKGDFRGNLEKAMRYGLSGQDALAMLTTEPAAILGVDKELGTLDVGKLASFVVASGDLFTLDLGDLKPAEKKKAEAKTDEKTGEKKGDQEGEKAAEKEPAKDADKDSGKPGDDRGEKKDSKKPKAEIREVYVDGVRYEVAPVNAGALAGTWDLTIDPPARINDGTIELVISESGELSVKKSFIEAKDEKGKPKVATVKAKGVAFDSRRVQFSFDHAPFGGEGIYTATATVAPNNASMSGLARTAGGDVLKWRAERKATSEDAKPLEPSLVGVHQLTQIDDKPQGGSLICIRKDRKVTLRQGNSVLDADDVVFDGSTVRYTVDMNKLRKGAAAENGKTLVKVEFKLTGDEVSGSMVIPDGSTHTWKGVRKSGDPEVLADLPDALGYPFGAYAREDREEYAKAPATIVIANATVWTSGAKGIIPKGYVVLKDGKIQAVGEGAAPTVDGATVIDATGKHVTPGIIDCHSHTGISRGVNEGGQAITSEVRIQDVTDPDSISWYRQLAGGVTTVNNLHGSANAIGGQNAVNKNRWGAVAPDDLHFAGRDTYSDANPYAPGAGKRDAIPSGVKWALGENPRAVNWGAAEARRRYPQTRMGVETIIRDRLTAAREYRRAWAAWAAGARGTKDAPVLPPRRDLELEALAEVLEGTRLVHCHSYRQDEIVMLARVAKEFGFQIGTFQHILEGYKAAVEVRDSSRGASAFSDWWNFKLEVQDAIAQGPTLMHEVGVVVSYNSDSDEMARRLNLEAAKAVKYGGVSEAEALKFVTINPAIQLGIEAKTGSLEVGKDADVVVWSGNPLSVSTRAERTIIDGRVMFSLDLDKTLRDQNKQHRERIVQKLKKEGPTRGGADEGSRDSSEGDAAMLTEADLARDRWILDRLNRRGSLDPNMPGVCGCGVLHE
ncbi:MAG: amidohydrolase family protein [Phycisphaerales bacterium]|nr:amidohydrolase family protein [Phycisphaerales bacterium]